MERAQHGASAAGCPRAPPCEHCQLHDAKLADLGDERAAHKARSGATLRPMHQETLRISTSRRGLHDITALVAQVVANSGLRVALCTVFVQHTSASLVIQENADPSVLRDLERWLSSVAPESRAWEHNAEGPDDMPAHAKASLTNASENIPVVNGRLALGTWQAIYLWEHRSAPHTRNIIVHVA